MKRVVITGLGIVSSIGNNAKEVTESLREGRSGIEFSQEYADLGFRSHVHAPVHIDTKEHIDRKALRFMGDAAAYNYIAMKQAIEDSELPEEDVSNPRTGIIVGSGGGSNENIVAATDALREKGLISELRSETDRRSLSYNLTPKGRRVLAQSNSLNSAFKQLSVNEVGQLERSLRAVLNTSLRSNGLKPFGVCNTCKHFAPGSEGGFCKLLKVPLEKSEAEKICVENHQA